jgi:DNA uptake protein ComE-like DNA-binding protein
VQEYGLPVQWTVTAEELSKVKGISKDRAAKIIATTEQLKGKKA